MPSGDIRFDDVVFGYEDAPVLRGLSFVAEAGRTTALVGPSGAGKTTVLALLSRLVDADSGVISIGGTSVRDIEIEALRAGIAVVSQESALFDETIATKHPHGPPRRHRRGGAGRRAQRLGAGVRGPDAAGARTRPSVPGVRPFRVGSGNGSRSRVLC